MPQSPVPKLYAPFAPMPVRQLETNSQNKDSKDNSSKEAEKEPQSPISPQPPLPGVLKAVREYEHSRKSHRKKAETRARKAHKAHCVDPLAAPGLTCPHCRHPGAPNESKPKMLYVKGFRLNVGDGQDDSLDVGETDWVAGVERRPEVAEVPLAELLKPAKARKTRQKAGDFEVVPQVRSVIALEESPTAEPEVNEPWEYVDWDADNPDAVDEAPSYADVLTSDV